MGGTQTGQAKYIHVFFIQKADRETACESYASME